MKDDCYHKAKSSYDVFPSARASQAIAKCRKKKGKVRKTEKGKDLKRWEKEEWKDVRTGKACGEKTKGTPYCRPSKRVSSKTPKTSSEMSKSEKSKKIKEKKSVGRGKRVGPTDRRTQKLASKMKGKKGGY
jgi:hypothetical protein